MAHDYKNCPRCGTKIGGLRGNSLYRCESCGNYFCRKCRVKKIISTACPNCGSKKVVFR